MLDDNKNNLPSRQQVGANFPPEPIDDVAPEDRRIAALVANADQHAAAHPVIEDAEVADAAANWRKQLTDHIEECKEKFKAEKAPHEAALEEIRAKYHPRLDKLDVCLKSITTRLRAWIKFDDARQKAAAAAAAREAAEAERRATQLAEQAQAKAGGPSAVTNTIIAMEAAQKAELARKTATAMPTRAQLRPSFGGATLSLRTVWRALMVEQDLFYLHVRDHKDVKVLLQSLANAAARHGARNPPEGEGLPGCEIFSTQE